MRSEKREMRNHGMKKSFVHGGLVALTALAVCGCASKHMLTLIPVKVDRPADAPVAEVAAIDAKTGEELTEKREFVTDGYRLRYRIHTPAVCEKDVSYPLVLFLHGAGERGDDNTRQLVHGVVPICRYAMKHGDAFVVAPQCPEHRKWVNQDWSEKTMKRPNAPSEEMAAVMKMLDQLVRELPIDKGRIYVTGISMGGFGTWDLVARKRGFFAAMMPICGGVDEHTAKDYDCKERLGIRFFHGGADDVVTPDFSRRMDKALTDAGVVHGYTEYPGVNHDCWTRTYADDENLFWLFGHTNTMYKVK